MAVSFDVASSAAIGNNNSLSWTHTSGGSADFAIVAIGIYRTSGTVSGFTVTIGGVAMTQIAIRNSASTTAGRVALYGLASPPTGSQTVSVSASASASGGALVGAAASYVGVDSADTPVTAGYSTTTSSNSVTVGSVAAGDMAVFAHEKQLTTAFTSYNQTQRATNAGPSQVRLLLGDSVSTGSVTATGGQSSTSAWGAIGVRLIQKVDIPEGVASGGYGWSSAATGKKPSKGSASGSYTWAGSATGKSPRRATSSGTYSWGSTAVGARTPKATASGAYQWETGSVGEANYEGQGFGSYTWVGAAVGQTPVDVPTGSGSYGWDGSAVGYSHRVATVDATYGWAATPVGKREPKGNAGTSDYAFVGTATGKRVAKAAAGGAYAFDLDEAVGFRTGTAFASGGYKWVALATGLFVPKPVAGVVGWYAE